MVTLHFELKVVDYVPGGELFFLLRARIRFEEDAARFYAAEILIALEYLH
jgi:protein kinase A